MSKISNILNKKKVSCLPIWFMRQAGRYLPEFRKIRSKNTNFIKLCLNSDLSSEITLQPIKRFNLDAAIIFSDILMVPYALGQKVNFIKNEGPILSSFNLETLNKISIKEFTKKLNPVYEAIKKTRNNLSKEKSLISFIGAPWTLIIYMLNLKKQKNVIDLSRVKEKEKDIEILLEKLHKFLVTHIENQIDAGADVLQIFDSWAGLIPEDKLNEYCYLPNLRIVEFCKKKGIPTICFPKGLKENYSKFLSVVKPNGLNIDYEIDPTWARKNLSNACIQGGMDPKIMLLEEDEMIKEAEKYIKAFDNFPYIFNLGHGLLPETDPKKVEALVNFVKSYK